MKQEEKKGKHVCRYWFYIIERIPTWDRLWGVRNNTLVKTAVIWLVIVPILAKLFDKMVGPIEINVGSQPLIFNLSLPFSWQLFFWAAVAFSIGGFLVNFLCPDFIKDHRNFDEFKKAGKGWPQLNWQIKQLYYSDWSLAFAESNRALVNKYMELFHKKKFDSDRQYNKKVIDFILSNKASTEDEGHAYAWIYRRACNHTPGVRFAATLIYFIGFCLFLWVAIQNVHYVYLTGGIHSIVTGWLESIAV